MTIEVCSRDVVIPPWASMYTVAIMFRIHIPWIAGWPYSMAIPCNLRSNCTTIPFICWVWSSLCSQPVFHGYSSSYHREISQFPLLKNHFFKGQLHLTTAPIFRKSHNMFKHWLLFLLDHWFMVHNYPVVFGGGFFSEEAIRRGIPKNPMKHGEPVGVTKSFPSTWDIPSGKLT